MGFTGGVFSFKLDRLFRLFTKTDTICVQKGRMHEKQGSVLLLLSYKTQYQQMVEFWAGFHAIVSINQQLDCHLLARMDCERSWQSLSATGTCHVIHGQMLAVHIVLKLTAIFANSVPLWQFVPIAKPTAGGMSTTLQSKGTVAGKSYEDAR